MGMAASQARFLGLTARKNNVEFEGQQVNQQRTTLSNQSANYYNDLLGMSVPVPPSVDSFTKTVYTFNDGALANEITALIAQNDGLFKVSYLQQWEDDFAPVSAATSVIMKNGDNYMVGNDTLRVLGSVLKATEDTTDYPLKLIDKKNNIFEYTKDATPHYIGYNADEQKWYSFTKDGGSYERGDEYTGIVSPILADDKYLNSLSIKQLIDLNDQEYDYRALLEAEYGAAKDGWFVRYILNSSDDTYKPNFYDKENVTTATYINDISSSSIACYTIGSKTRTDEVKGKYSRVEKDTTGRYINITIYENEADAQKNVKGIKYALTTSTITDQAAYEDAMNQYEFDKAQYDQAIQEINSKIEIVQAEDKNLELRLKQLDTEQEAIQTELDAVEKVIQKNTESSFKTFG